MRLRGLSIFGTGLVTLSLLCLSAACGSSPKKPGAQGTGSDTDASTKPDSHAGTGGHGGRSGSGGELDAGSDASSIPDIDSAVPDGSIHVMPQTYPVPDDWVCPKAYWMDLICDCGCGAQDIDCTGSSCTTPGCVNAQCGVCHTEAFAWKLCEDEPNLGNATCDSTEMNDSQCDCGCDVPDPACHGNGCTEPGCWRQACDARHDARKDTTGLNPRIYMGPPFAWTCPVESWGAGDGCDCGCGATDPDCPSSGGDCVSPLCPGTNAICNTCHDKDGAPVICSPVYTASINPWTCDPHRYGDSPDFLPRNCDCGCGIQDPDCTTSLPVGAGCSGLGCRVTSATECTSCTDSSLPSDESVGCTPASPATLWTCDPHHYGTGDGCDCGCGAHDPDCGDAANGCETSGCPDDGACDYCHKGPTDAIGDYMLCKPASGGGWSCGDENDIRWTNAECDCGCTKPDPYCRTVNKKKGCTAPDCNIPVCEFCNGANPRAACSGDRWSGSKLCNAKAYDDGVCDCGCGAIDSVRAVGSDVGDCATGTGCKDSSCAANGCEVCHAPNGDLVKCHDWTCDAAAYGDGKCDCGCGADDPDCAGHGCTEPGCNATNCETCHDPKGRPTKACP